MNPTNWWQPGKPEVVLPGVLFEDKEDGWVLQVHGNFIEPEVHELEGGAKTIFIGERLPENLPIVVGFTSDHKMVSLIECRPVLSSPAFGTSRGSLKLWPTTLVFGVHFENADTCDFVSLSVRYRHLDAWVATSGFQVILDTNFRPISITYSKPESVDCQLTDGLTLSIEFSASGPTMPVITDLQMSQRSWLTISAAPGRAYKTLLEHLASFANLIAIFVGEPLIALEIEGSCDAMTESGEQIVQPVGVVDNRKPVAAGSASEVRPWDILFRLPDVRAQFSVLAQTWFTRGDSLQSLYDLYFGALHGPARYVEHRFLNVFQALESFDRRTFAPDPEKVKAHEERLARIFGAVTPKDQKWLKGKLRRSQEPSAGERIQRLVNDLNAEWLLTKDDVEPAQHLRNYYVHFDPEIEARLPSKKGRFRIMHNLTVRLRVLCELVLLNAIGLPKEEARKRIEETRRVRRHLVAEI